MPLSELSVRRTRSICVICCGLIAALVAFAQSASTAAPEGVSDTHGASSGAVVPHFSAGPNGTDRLAVGKVDRPDASIEVEGGTVRPVPRNPIVIHHVVHPDGTHDIVEPSGRTGGPPYEKLIYSNTHGSSIWVPRIIGLPAADDWSTISVNGCPMTGYSVTVNGGGGGEESFIAVMVLYDGCPGAGGEQIPGTLAIFHDLDDDETIMHELTMVFDPPLDIPPTVWARVAFSTATAGWVFDSAAEIGFSADSFWLPLVGSNSCDVYFGGAPPHASFWGQVTAADGACSGVSQEQCSTTEDCPQGETCEGGCATHFLAYSAAVASGDRYYPPSEGEPTRVGDDFTLTVTDCELSSYELGVRAFGGPFTIDIDLRPNGLGSPYEGTQRTLTGIGDGRLEIMRATFPEGGIFIDQYSMMTWKPNRSNVSAINAMRTLGVGPVEDYYPPDIDTPGQYFWLLDSPGFPGWSRFDEIAREPAIFYIVINCKGTPPTGACCPAQIAGEGVHCFDDATMLECLGSRWMQDVSCAEDPFAPPCGTHACCRPDDTCSDLLYEECEAACAFIGGERCGNWDPGDFCGQDGQSCPIFVCSYATGDCLSESPCAFFDCECTGDEQCQVEFGLGPTSQCIAIAGRLHVCTPGRGCGSVGCCDAVCRNDEFCCDVAWDSSCVDAVIGLSDTACRMAPGNDECAPDWLPNTGWDLGAGAVAISLAGGVGEVVVDLHRATVGLDDPPLCCNHRGLDHGARYTRWYKFTMPVGETSARIHTCDTSDSFDASNSILQVFQIADASVGICSDGSACAYGGGPGQCPAGECLEDKDAVCQELIPFACNDDAEGCGFTNENSRLCIDGLEPGATYYILIGAPGAAENGTYSLRVEVPCPIAAQLPGNDACEAATVAFEGTTPFNLADATFQCPGEDCLPAMKNDVWFLYTADCVGLLRAETCDPIPNHVDPATTLAVYVATIGDPPTANCPPTTDPIACNDDGEVVVIQEPPGARVCRVSRLPCWTDADCSGFCSETGLECGTDADCRQCSNFKYCTVGQNPCVDDSWCNPADPIDVCEGIYAPCITSGDCRWCSHSHERCRDNFKHCSLSEGTCNTAADCPLPGEACEKACQLRFCSVSATLREQDRDLCGVSATLCEQDSDCPIGETCNDQVCVICNGCVATGQTCVQEVCEAPCGRGSALLAPVFLGQTVYIRVGGEFGGEPSGDLFLECVHADCNNNGIPDAIDVQGPDSTDCNQNLRPDDCDIAFGSSIDCDFDGMPDECQIELGSDVTCKRCSISGAACFFDDDCGQDGGTCSVTVPASECDEGPFYCLIDCDPDADLNGIPDACETASEQGLIFALRVVEKNGVNLRTCDDGDNVGLSCMPGRTRCVGGTEDGEDCLTDIYCPGGGTCEPDCPGFGASCVGVDDIDADPTDVLVLDATVRRFDDNPIDGRCTGEGENDPACRRDSDCPDMHCTDTLNPCSNDFPCNNPATCVDDTCDPYPTAGTFQWTIDGENSYDTGDAGSLVPYMLETGGLPCEGTCIGGNNDGLPCTNLFDCLAGGGVCSENATNDICRHGALFGTQCTCFFSGCDEGAGLCDINATAYIMMSRKDYLHSCCASLALTTQPGPSWTWWGVLQDVIDPQISDDGVHYYIGTLWLTSTADACGTFTVDMMHDPHLTFLTRFDQVIFPGATFEGVTINFPCQPLSCPDGNCTGDETACTCPEDCPDVCGDGCCTGTEDAMTCPQDCERPCVDYESSVPNSSPVGDDTIHPPGTLWRTTGNVIRITFDGAATAAPNAGDVEIRELQDGGAFGPNLSASFDFSMEDGNTVLRIADTGSTILHQKWYAIINVSWDCVMRFERHYASAYGDGDGDGLVQFADLAFINAMINQPPASPDADRHDINGDNLIQFADLAAANATMHLHAISKPTGH